MPKWCHLGKYFVPIRNPKVFLKCVLAVLSVIATINFFSCYGYYNYPHISQNEIDTALYKEVVPAIRQQDLLVCSYEHVLNSTQTTQTWQVPKNYGDFDANGIVNGSYSPPHCKPRFSVAVLVTHRNRQRQLDIFLPYIHNFLRKQDIHYKIYLIEQVDEKPWNKGLLYNIGALHAMDEQFPCLILHDVDLLPLDAGNLYACSLEPRHLSGSLNTFRFLLPYTSLIGGVLAIRADQFKLVNGFSNRFLNWGGEDDDFYMRLTEHGLRVTRFHRSISRYTMVAHVHAPRNAQRFAQKAANRRDTAAARAADGLAHARASAATLHAEPHRLFMRIAVTT